MLFEIPGQDLWPRIKLSWHTYSMSRPLIELALRRKVQCIRNIKIRSGCRVRQIVSDSQAASAISYQTGNRNLKKLESDLIVDASGNGFLTVQFLKATGRRPPAETSIGMTVALQEVDILFNLLRTLDGNPLATLAPSFLTKAERLISDPCAMSAIPDFIYPEPPVNAHQTWKIVSISGERWAAWPPVMRGSSKC
jgi:hypothetical protein